MEQGSEPGPKKLVTRSGKTARTKRIFATQRRSGLRRDCARLTSRCVRQIVNEVQDRRKVDGDAAHAFLQLGLGPALRAAGEAVAEGDVRAIVLLIKVLDRLDRYQKTARTDPSMIEHPLSAGDKLVVEDFSRRMRESVLQELTAERGEQRLADVP